MRLTPRLACCSLFSALALALALPGAGLAAPATPDLLALNATRADARLSWPRVDAAALVLERAPAGGEFALLASLPAGVTAYEDAGLAPGTYEYRLTAVGADGVRSEPAVREVIAGTAGIDLNGGFADAGEQLKLGGSAKLVDGNVLRLTDDYGQSARALTRMRLDIRRFSTRFKIHIHGNALSPGDGMAFLLTADRNDRDAWGAGWLGSGSLEHTATVKFDTYDNAGETNNSTGIFFNGAIPTVPPLYGFDQLTRLDGTGIVLRSETVKLVELDYDGTTLVETITDLFSDAAATASYQVDLPARLGGNFAFAGFSAGTGGAYSLHDVLGWTFFEAKR